MEPINRSPSINVDNIVNFWLWEFICGLGFRAIDIFDCHNNKVQNLIDHSSEFLPCWWKGHSTNRMENFVDLIGQPPDCAEDLQAAGETLLTAVRSNYLRCSAKYISSNGDPLTDADSQVSDTIPNSRALLKRYAQTGLGKVWVPMSVHFDLNMDLAWLVYGLKLCREGCLLNSWCSLDTIRVWSQRGCCVLFELAGILMRRRNSSAKTSRRLTRRRFLKRGWPEAECW